MPITSELIQDIKDFKKRHVLDVRERDEFGYGHIPNALNMPLSEIAETYHELSKDIPYTLVCQSGARSMQVAQFLNSKGFTVINGMGGMMSYRGEVVS